MSIPKLNSVQKELRKKHVEATLKKCRTYCAKSLKNLQTRPELSTIPEFQKAQEELKELIVHINVALDPKIEIYESRKM